MPFFTRMFGLGEFGDADLITKYAQLLLPIVSVGIANAVIRYGLDKTYNKASVFTGGPVSYTHLAPFYGRNYAHRGLHSRDKSVPENSLTAFRLAAEAGYGIELDIQLSKDGQVVVFHDDTLDRVCGVHGRVDAFTLEELRGMRLCGTDERIPLLTEVFAVVAGRSPFIIELKTGPRNAELCEKGLALMRAYDGPYCVESFDPRIVGWFKKHAPDLLRGQLAGPPKTYDNMPAAGGLVLGNLLGNVCLLYTSRCV